MMITAILLATSMAAASPSARDTVQAHVSYADLDLSNEAGVRTLDRRVRNAVRKVCGSLNGVPLSQRRAVAQCYASAQQAAERNVETVIARARMDRQLANASLAVATTR